MEKSKLTPFDAETFLMIESITGAEPEVVQNKVSYKISVCTYNMSDEKITAIKKAVSGRLGKRLYNTESGINKIVFSVDYEENAEKMPNELRTNLGMPDETAGNIYCRRLLEIRALPVKRDNLEKLLMFTGGGTMTIPRTPGGIAIYSFPTENGVMMDVPENWYIIRYPDGRFAKMGIKEFDEGFEPKDTSKQSISAHGKNDIYYGNCAAFKCEDMNGDGYCETCDTMRHCGDLACHEWQSKAENQQYKHFEERFNNKQ